MNLFVLIFYVLTIVIESEAKKGACVTCNCYWRNDRKYVDCSYLGLTNIPEGISLKTSRLYLNGNNITNVGETSTFGPSLLPKLRVLHLHNNPIQMITDDAFKNVANINTLLLHYTNVSIIPNKLLSNLTSLRYIWINNANLNKIESDAFNGMHKLQQLLLNNNNISHLPSGAFRDLPKLSILHLYNTDLETANCCNLCNLPTGVDLKWGTVPMGQQLSCGCSGPVNCSSSATSDLMCFQSGCSTYTFNSSFSLMHSLFMSISLAIFATSASMALLELI